MRDVPTLCQPRPPRSFTQGPAVEYPREKSVFQLFEEQVARTPEAPALEVSGTWICYRELNSRANQLAHYLRRRGVQPGTLVGICLERSAGVVIGIYAILKAGGVYVPLDPTYPPDRLR